MAAGKQCRACGYYRQDGDDAPEGQCPKCDRWYVKTDKLGETAGSGEDPNDPGLVRAQLAEARRRREREELSIRKSSEAVSPLPKRNGPGLLVNALALAVSIGIFVYLGVSGHLSGGSNPTKSLGEDLIGACVAAQMFMERRLRSPSTADFASCAPRAGETDVEVLTRSPYRYRVTSYVDAENAFGGIVREQFTAEVESGGGDWTLRSIQ